MHVTGATSTVSRRDVQPEFRPDEYAFWRASQIGIISERLERRAVLELAGDVCGRTVLDVGSGDGILALVLAKLGADVTGIDSSAAMIDAAGRRAKRHGVEIAFERAHAEWLPCHPEEFDLVTVVTVLCFFQDPRPVLEEIARALKPGGRLVIGELGRWSSWAVGRRIRDRVGPPIWRHAKFRTARELRELVERTGLSVETVRGALYYPRWARAARWLSPYDPRVGRHTTAGAGFIALAARKPQELRLRHPEANRLSACSGCSYRY